jgi:hypothetical protein
MEKDQRRILVQQIESETGSRLICYVTGDSRGLETKIAGDLAAELSAWDAASDEALTIFEAKLD